MLGLTTPADAFFSSLAMRCPIEGGLKPRVKGRAHATAYCDSETTPVAEKMLMLMEYGVFVGPSGVCAVLGSQPWRDLVRGTAEMQ